MVDCQVLFCVPRSPFYFDIRSNKEVIPLLQRGRKIKRICDRCHHLAATFQELEDGGQETAEEQECWDSKIRSRKRRRRKIADARRWEIEEGGKED